MTLVLYADFASPECYLASRRADALAAAGSTVDWRAVEVHPRVSVGGRLLGPDDRAGIADQMAAVTTLLLPGEQLPWTPPDFVPKTEAAVSGYAEAYGAGVADDVRRLLYAAYWLGGADIGNPEVLRPRLAGPILRGHPSSSPLRESGYAVTVSRSPITTAAWRRIRSWRDEWHGLATGVVPTLVVEGSCPVTGETALRWLEKEIIRTAAGVTPDLPDPARYPAVPARPPREWVSRVGGRWRNSWMTSP